MASATACGVRHEGLKLGVRNGLPMMSRRSSALNARLRRSRRLPARRGGRGGAQSLWRGSTRSLLGIWVAERVLLPCPKVAASVGGVMSFEGERHRFTPLASCCTHRPAAHHDAQRPRTFQGSRPGRRHGLAKGLLVDQAVRILFGYLDALAAGVHRPAAAKFFGSSARRTAAASARFLVGADAAVQEPNRRAARWASSLFKKERGLCRGASRAGKPSLTPGHGFPASVGTGAPWP